MGEEEAYMNSLIATASPQSVLNGKEYYAFLPLSLEATFERHRSQKSNGVKILLYSFNFCSVTVRG